MLSHHITSSLWFGPLLPFLDWGGIRWACPPIGGQHLAHSTRRAWMDPESTRPTIILLIPHQNHHCSHQWSIGAWTSETQMLPLRAHLVGWKTRARHGFEAAALQQRRLLPKMLWRGSDD